MLYPETSSWHQADSCPLFGPCGFFCELNDKLQVSFVILIEQSSSFSPHLLSGAGLCVCRLPEEEGMRLSLDRVNYISCAWICAEPDPCDRALVPEPGCCPLVQSTSTSSSSSSSSEGGPRPFDLPRRFCYHPPPATSEQRNSRPVLSCWPFTCPVSTPAAAAAASQ